jgi:hypothetical protein
MGLIAFPSSVNSNCVIQTANQSDACLGTFLFWKPLECPLPVHHRVQQKG